MHKALLESVPINQTVIRLIKDDITDLDVDAFVFYAQPDLALGSGFGTAISIRGGPSIQKELETLAPVAPCEAVVSAAGKLKAKYIIHAVGPRFREEDIEGKLHATVLNSLERADEKGIERIALPAMGAGYYGVPPDVCARVMLEAIKTHLGGETGIKELTICALDTVQHQAFESRLKTFS
ncbi:MAG: macro domain-containing protein [Planctomycetota bacterium]